jgi:inorganic pyrophosphatase/exopolyphosphatase
VTLVDHNALSARLFPDAWQARVVRVIDHHEDSGMYADRADRVIELVGSCSSLVYRDVVATTASASDARDVARLLLGAIVLDTRMLDATTTRAAPVDFAAAESLRDILGWDEDTTRAEYDTLSRARHDQSSFACSQLLAKDYKQWTMGSLEVGIASFGVRFQDLLARQGASSVDDDIVAFVDTRRIDVLVMMTSFEDVDADGAFARQIDVTKSPACAIEIDDIMRDLGARTPLAPLRLPENDRGVFKAARAQLDVKASRKKVQPILTEIFAARS